MSENKNDGEMPLVAHLVELRDRLLRILAVILALFLGLVYFANDIYQFVSEPLRRFLPEGTTMIATDVASPFFTPFKLTFVVALVLAIPYVLYQVWSFVAPGMYKHEKRIAIPLLVSSVLLFYSGLAFAYFLVFPLVFGFFSGVGPEGITYTPDIARFLDVALKLFLAFGAAFEIPVATVLLVWSGTVSTAALVQKRRYIIVGCFIVGMLLTPPDIFSQTLLAVPMWMLFEAGIFFGRLIEKQNGETSQQSG